MLSVLMAFAGAVVLFTGCTDDITRLTGTVTDQSGNPVPGVMVFAMERTSDARFGEKTNDQGWFHFDVHPGTYDIGYLADGYVVDYEGPGLAFRKTDVNHVMLPATAKPAASLYGRLVNPDQSPASGWTVRMSSCAVDSGETSSCATTTNGQGEFELTVIGEMVLDLDFVSPAGDSEFVDIAKMADRACHVDFTVGTGTANTMRHSYSPGIMSEPLGGNETFDYRSGGGGALPQYYGGKLVVNGGRMQVWHTSKHQTSYEVKCYVADDGWWPVYDYAVHIHGKVYGKGTIDFVDETRDRYMLIVTPQGEFWWHRVNYNSEKPTIVNVCKPYSP